MYYRPRGSFKPLNLDQFNTTRWKLRIVLPVEKFGQLIFYYPHMFRQKQTDKTKYQAPKLSTLQRAILADQAEWIIAPT